LPNVLGNLLVAELLGSSGTSGAFWEVLGSLTELGFYHFHFFLIAIDFAVERSRTPIGFTP
jgi:hypothetical protein